MIYLEIENQDEPSIQRKKRKEKKSEFQPEMAIPVVSNRGTGRTEVLGQESCSCFPISKIQQYQHLFPDEWKKLKIKKNCA